VSTVVPHDTHGRLVRAIMTGFRSSGKTPGTVGVDDLSPADEFRVGGRTATDDLMEQLPS
jgi:hypothetical protein